MRRTSSIALALLLPVTFVAAQQKKVVLTSSGAYYSPLGEKEIAELQAFAPGVRLVAPAKEQLMAELSDADGIIGTISPAILKAAPKLQWVQVGVAGVERILTPELKSSNVTLTNCKIVQGPEIADHAFALLLALTRELNRSIPRRTQEEWTTRAYNPIELRGKTAVIVGVGGIGTQIAVRAAAFGMQVIGVDPKDLPYVPFLQRTVPPDRLDSVLPGADVVFISAPHTKLSEKMIGARQFELMKTGAYFIVVSRGALYDGEALAKAIEAKHLAGAGLDVTDPEPLPKGHALWKFENVIITPHIAGRSDGEQRRYVELFKENLRRFGAGETLLNVVDKQKGY
ncbi:MAG TPA: D-2-hydroxyacid dehydrogenase [Acidobacteriota bacterium]|nr:D-2-hydroxyacid dehydrogenase [Acidobacteriota bacterium]